MADKAKTCVELGQIAHDAITKVVACHDLNIDVSGAPGGQPGMNTGKAEYHVAESTTGRPRLRMSRPMHRREGRTGTMIEKAVATGRTASKSVADAVNELFDPYVRLVHRDRQMERAGLEPVDGTHSAPAPAWAYSINPVTLAYLTAEGLGPDDIVMTALSDLRAMINDRHMSKYKLYLDGARITHRLINLSDKVFYNELYAVPKISVHQRLPSTMLAGLVGSRIDSIISHPWLDGIDAVVTAVRDKTNDDDSLGAGMVDFELFIPDVLVGAFPEGLGEPWHLSHMRQGPLRR